jgi:hypothetical protein
MVTKFIQIFAGTLGDWDDSDLTYYQLFILFATHGITDPTFKVWKLTGSDYIEVFPEVRQYNATTDDITIKIPKTSSIFAGKVTIVG